MIRCCGCLAFGAVFGLAMFAALFRLAEQFDLNLTGI